MAKETKTAPAATAASPAPAKNAPAEVKKPTPVPITPVAGIDISKLTPEQLLALQKQLKQKTSTSAGVDSKPRFAIIDKMLQEKDEAGAFMHTTRQIMNALVEAKLVNTGAPGYEQTEIKKIQARKQFLEKRRGTDGNLLSAPGTYGYKQSENSMFTTLPDKIMTWFKDEKNVEKLTADQKQEIMQALE